MSRNGSYEQCCKCGAWRQRKELAHHMNICNAFRCPQCGMPAHNGHACINNTMVYKTKDSLSIIRVS